MQNDEIKNVSPHGSNTMLAAVLMEQLDKWIEYCQTQADVFLERGVTISEAS